MAIDLYSLDLWPNNLDLDTHVAGSQRWEGLCTSRDTWRHIRYSADPDEQGPTTVPHTQSSRWETWLTIPRSCVESYLTLDRWVPAASSCTRASSVWCHTHTRTHSLHSNSSTIIIQDKMKCTVFTFHHPIKNQWLRTNSSSFSDWRATIPAGTPLARFDAAIVCTSTTPPLYVYT